MPGKARPLSRKRHSHAYIELWAVVFERQYLGGAIMYALADALHSSDGEDDSDDSLGDQLGDLDGPEEQGAMGDLDAVGTPRSSDESDKERRRRQPVRRLWAVAPAPARLEAPFELDVPRLMWENQMEQVLMITGILGVSQLRGTDRRYFGGQVLRSLHDSRVLYKYAAAICSESTERLDAFIAAFRREESFHLPDGAKDSDSPWYQALMKMIIVSVHMVEICKTAARLSLPHKLTHYLVDKNYFHFDSTDVRTDRPDYPRQLLPTARGFPARMYTLHIEFAGPTRVQIGHRVIEYLAYFHIIDANNNRDNDITFFIVPGDAAVVEDCDWHLHPLSPAAQETAAYFGGMILWPSHHTRVPYRDILYQPPSDMMAPVKLAVGMEHVYDVDNSNELVYSLSVVDNRLVESHVHRLNAHFAEYPYRRVYPYTDPEVYADCAGVATLLRSWGTTSLAPLLAQFQTADVIPLGPPNAMWRIGRTSVNIQDLQHEFINLSALFIYMRSEADWVPYISGLSVPVPGSDYANWPRRKALPANVVKSLPERMELGRMIRQARLDGRDPAGTEPDEHGEQRPVVPGFSIPREEMYSVAIMNEYGGHKKATHRCNRCSNTINLGC